MLQILPFTLADADPLISWFENEEELIQFSGPTFRFPLTREQISTHIANPDHHVFKAIDLESSLIIGHGEIRIVANEPPKLTCLIIGNKKFRGMGFGKELTRQLTAIAFERFHAEFVQLYVYEWNKNALELYKSLGFVINRLKTLTTELNGQSWVALNMTISR